MNKRIFRIVSSCIILVLLLVIFLLDRERTYPSVVDSSCIIAPNIEFTATLQEVDKEQQLVCTIENKNTCDITYGAEYYIEIKKNGKWCEVVDRSGKRADDKDWIALLYGIQAKGCLEFVISLNEYSNLADGEYRIVKEVDLSENGTYVAGRYMMASFQVKSE